jgi:hypothetical protein
MAERMRSKYGAAPLHLVASLASFAVAGYAFLRIAESPSALSVFIYFGIAAMAHDMLAFPFYSALNLIVHRSLVGPSDEWLAARRVPAINYVRIPAMLSAISLLIFFPLILGLDSANFSKDTGLSSDVYLGRWLGLCAALFAGSALIYAIALRRAKPVESVEPPGPIEASGD